MPLQKGGDYCTRSIREQYPGFKPLPMVTSDVMGAMMFNRNVDKITISGGGGGITVQIASKK